jgi:nucleoside-diphosphate-sugar epimerase
MTLNGRKILVTGACGFIGSHLAERLVIEGADVRAFARYDSLNSGGNLQYCPPGIRQAMEIIHADLRDPFSVYQSVKDTDIVLHLGALVSIPYSYQSPMDFVQANILGTVHVLQASLELGVQHLVITSTSEVYGTAKFVPITEEHPLVGQSPYAASKIACEKLAESFSRSYNLPLTILRPFNTFGERQSARAFIPSVISQALYHDRICVGSLDPQRDFNYVGDIVDGFVKACRSEHPSGEVYNLGSGTTRSMREVVQEIQALLPAACPVIEDARRLRPGESEVWCLQASAEKAGRDLGWSTNTGFREGLSKVMDFVRAHPEVYADPGCPL